MSTLQSRTIRQATRAISGLTIALATALTLALALASPAFAANPATGSGEFTSRGVTMPVVSSVAYRGKSLLDKEDVIIVAISNEPFDVPWMTNFYDRSRMIDKRHSSDRSGVVYLEFKPDGSYKAHHFYFKSGNGCGYCAGGLGVTSTVKLANGRMVGALKIKDTEKAADFKIDAPLLSDDHGTALPPDGGEPGKAYLAYHEALLTGQPAKVLPTMSKDAGKEIQEDMKNGRGAQALKDFTSEHPTKSVKILRGWSKGDKAVLLWEGESRVVKLTGETVLVREGGRWVVDDEVADAKLN